MLSCIEDRPAHRVAAPLESLDQRGKVSASFAADQPWDILNQDRLGLDFRNDPQELGKTVPRIVAAESLAPI
jgi:hypothetical protein